MYVHVCWLCVGVRVVQDSVLRPTGGTTMAGTLIDILIIREDTLANEVVAVIIAAPVVTLRGNGLTAWANGLTAGTAENLLAIA